MGFIMTPHTDDMARHVRDTFVWSLRGSAAPPSPLPEDADEWCPDFDAQEAEEIAREAGLPELVQATFYAMVLGVARQRDVVTDVQARLYWVMLEGLRWRFFESFMHGRRAAIMGEPAQEAPAVEGAAALPETPTDRVAGYMREACRWTDRGTTDPPRPLLQEYMRLCPSFDLPRAQSHAASAGIPELTTAVFYVMVTDSARGRGIISVEAVMSLKRALFTLRWRLVEDWLDEHREDILQGRLLRSSEREARLAQGDAPAPSDDEEE